MIDYEPFMIIINTLGPAKVIIDVISVCHYKILESIVTNQGLLFTSKFLLLCYFFKIQKKLSTNFHL